MLVFHVFCGTFVAKLPLLTCVHIYVCVLCFSVWDALTDNYISTWDGPDSEGLNGNLSEQEVQVAPHLSIWFRSWEMCCWACKKPIISKHAFLFWNGEFNWVSVAFSNMYGKHHFLWLTEANVF